MLRKLTVAKESVKRSSQSEQNGRYRITYSVTPRSRRSAVNASIKVRNAHMELGSRVIWARIIILTKIVVSFGTLPPLSGTPMASQLGYCAITSGELKEISGFRGMAQVTMLIRETMIGMWDRCDMIE